jgi:hypothetical protein
MSLMNRRIFICCRGKPSSVTSAQKLRGMIMKRNTIDKLLVSQLTVNTLKLSFPNYVSTIEKIESCSESLLNDLADVSRYPKHNYYPGSQMFIRSKIANYIDEFKDDQDVLELFEYILQIYT